jgi:integrase
MLRMYVLLLNETGLRCESEALWLRWEDLDLKAGFLTVEGARKGRRTKSGKSRKVPMTRRLREAVRDHMAAFRLKTYHGKPTPWVFHHETDRGHGKAGERYKSLREAFEGAAKRAGLPRDLHQHDLRHRRVTTWLQEGQPIHLVRDAMGHSTVQVTERYLHLVASDLLRLVEAPSEEELREMVTR